MPAIGGLFVVFLLVQALPAVVALRLARRRGDAAVALAGLVFVGGVIAAFAIGTMLEVIVVECLALGLYALVSRPNSTSRQPSRR